MNYEAQAVAHAEGLVIVGGDSSSVGLAGGYTQGGGHGPLVSTFGLGADQALEWEVITATGQYLKATPTENKDLYWALSGGGGGTYGVVLSLTVKAYLDMRVAAANLTFSLRETTPQAYYDTLGIFLKSLPHITDAGAVCIWLLTNETFAIQSLTAPGLSTQAVGNLLQPTLNKLDKEAVPYGQILVHHFYHSNVRYPMREARINTVDRLCHQGIPHVSRQLPCHERRAGSHRR